MNVHADEVRKAAVAGTFYPGDAKDISSLIGAVLKKVPAGRESEELIGIIVPHAGYVYAAPTAAHAYALVKGKKYNLVVLLGRSHRGAFKGALIDGRNAWETPLGRQELDTALYGKLSGNDLFRLNPSLMDHEHCLEVQVPFLQTVLPGVKIVPVLLGDAEIGNVRMVADALSKAVAGRTDVLLIASTDLSHFYPLDVAEKKDRAFTALMEQGDVDTICRQVSSEKVEVCGDAAVMALVMMAAARTKPFHVKLLARTTSADATGDRKSVVGYAAMALFTGAAKKTAVAAPAERRKDMLTADQRKKLLTLARETIECRLAGKSLPEAPSQDALFQEKRGVFVTLHKHGDLRGCIGYIMPVEPLWKAVRTMAVESATGDPRFPAVTLPEMKEIEVEISVLTVPRRVGSANEIVLKRDGVIVKKGFRQGVFLPQVAEETGWSREEFLNALCSHKAGLPADAWKDPDTELLTFQAEVFSEKK